MTDITMKRSASRILPSIAARISLLLLLLAVVPAVSAVTLSNYQYMRGVTVDCDQFVGYARLDVDGELLAASQNLQNLYVDTEYFFERGAERQSSNWYPQDTSAGDIDTMKRVVDGNTQSYVSVEKPLSELSVTFRNPTAQSIDKVTITTIDSEISTAVFNADGRPVAVKSVLPQYNGGRFSYVYLFDQRVTTSDLAIKLGFSNILKLSEVSFSSRGADKIDIFVNNECGRTYTMYYGGYGGTAVSGERHDMTRIIQASAQPETANPQYNPDFDADGAANEADNCVNVANADQADLNYNRVGDACEDFDHDGILDSKDNCPQHYNQNQMDADKDGAGDACDTVDSRFSEQNKWLFYVGGVIAVAIFAYFATAMLQKK